MKKIEQVDVDGNIFLDYDHSLSRTEIYEVINMDQENNGQLKVAESNELKKYNSENKVKKKKTGASFLCKVAGVTFHNPDGESRQKIIKNILEAHTSKDYYTGKGELVVSSYRDYKTGIEKPLLEVWMEGKHIGNVPTSETMEISKHPRIQSGTVIVQLMFLRQYDMYTAKVFAPARSEPTEKMKNAVNQILKKNPSLEKPEYTFDAYRQFLNEHKGGQVNQLRTKVIEIIV